MTTLPCPLPQVEEALRPYIQARQETLRIRKTLAQHLQSLMHRTERQHGAESTSPITSLTLACAPPLLLPEHDQTRSASVPAPPPPAELTGLRKQYWEAVQAHALAKRRRDGLHRELNELQREAHAARAGAQTGPATDFLPSSAAPMVGNSSGSNGNSSRHDIQSYVSLLHQRRRHARLQILLDALDRAADAEPDDDPLRRDDLRQWIKDRLGDAPVPPPEIAGGGSTAMHDASASAAAAAAADQTKEHVLRLKKELLLAKQNRDAEAQRRAAAVQASTESSALSRGVEAQVRALRAARDELIAWIEAELAKMPEGDESILSGGGTPQRPDRRDDKDTGTDDDADSIQEQVDALYERYVAARTSLVVAADAAAASAKELNAPSTLPGPNQQLGGDDGDSVGQKQQQPRLPPSAALPFIPALLRSANDERVIAQQIATHLRHQIAAAQGEARNTAQRLASESHLVGPDAESGGAWARAAMEATKETDEAISERVRAGEANVAGAKDILAELDRRKEGFRALRGEA